MSDAREPAAGFRYGTDPASRRRNARNRFSARRFIAFVPIFACFAGFLVCGQPANASGYLSARQKVELAKLRHDAEAARRELERGTKKWEEGRKRLDRAQAKLLHTEKRLFEADRRLDELRGPVAEVANAAYQSPAASSVAALVTAAEPRSALRAAADLHKINTARSAVIEEAARTRARFALLVRDANVLRKSTTAEADRLARLMHDLQRKAAAATTKLTRALRKLGVRTSRDERAPVGCDPQRAERATQYPNGLIPSWAMCSLPQSGQLLRADAAVAFYRLNAAYAARFGEELCVTDAYRSLGEQQSIYAQRPGMAAVPGSSLHGLGLAVDLCGGVQDYGSQRYNWMVTNSARFGWHHPAWANGSQFEPWHWEFDAPS